MNILIMPLAASLGSSSHFYGNDSQLLTWGQLIWWIAATQDGIGINPGGWEGHDPQILGWGHRGY